jgi:hypothetical protein
MDVRTLTLGGLAVVLALDWLATAVRAALLNASLARLLAARDENTGPVKACWTY